MFSRVFKKRVTKPGSRRAVSRSTCPEPESAEIIVDEALFALHSELQELAHIEVAQAAKERGWAVLQHELERRPVRRTLPVAAKGGRVIDGRTRDFAQPRGLQPRGLQPRGLQPRGAQPRGLQPVFAGARGWRIALSSAGVVVVIAAVLLGSYAAGLLTGGPEVTGPIASGTTVVSEPRTTLPAESTIPSPSSSNSTDVTPSTGTTTATTPTGSSLPSPDSTEVTVPATGSTPPTSAGSSGQTTVTTHPVTTVPPRTTTTNEQQFAAGQREVAAEAAVFDLADAVLGYFAFGEGDLAGLRSLVPSSVQAQLTQMIGRLNQPNGYNKVAVKSLSGNRVRITLEFTDIDPDRVDADGQPLKLRPRFAITVQVGESATITAITYGS